MCIKQEIGVSGNGEIIHRQGIESFVRLKLAGNRAQRSELGQTIRNEEDENDQQSVGGTFDLKVAKERVGAEEIDRFVDNVGLRGISY